MLEWLLSFDNLFATTSESLRSFYLHVLIGSRSSI